METFDYQRVERVRVELNMNVSAFAKAIGMTQPTYWRYINGQGVKLPAVAVMTLLDTYKVNPAYLKDGIEPMFVKEEAKGYDYEKLYEENISLKNSILQLQEQVIQYQRQEMSRLKNIEKPVQ